MKKILVVSHGAALGGSPISGLNIGRHIDKNQFEVIYAFGEEREIFDIAKKEGFKVFFVPKRSYLTIWDYAKIICREKIDIVHLNTLTSYYKYPAMAAWLCRKKIVWFVRENPEEKRCVRLGKYINALADRIVTVSLDTAKKMFYANHAKLCTIYNGIDLKFKKIEGRERLCEELGLSAREKYILCVASLEERKGVKDLVRAFLSSLPKLQGYKLLIVGEDRTKEQRYFLELKELAKDSSEVIFYGKSQKIQQLLSLSELFVLPSYWEGMARVILEAMACGLPVVASDAGGNREQVMDGVNGFLFPPRDIQALSTALEKAILGGRTQLLGENSRELLEKNFDIKETTKKIENLYKAL